MLSPIDSNHEDDQMTFLDKRKKLIFIFPVLFFISMGIIRLLSEDLYLHLTWPEFYLEHLQFVLYLLASGIFFLLFLQAKKKKKFILIFLLLSLILFFIAMEEINWGQVFFHFDAPQFLKQANTQNQFSFHNIFFFQKILHGLYMLVGFTLAFLPFFRSSILKLRHGNTIVLFLPDKSLFLYFFNLGFNYLLRDYLRYWIVSLFKLESFPVYSQELAETLLALGLFLYALILYEKRKTIFADFDEN